MSDFSPDSYKIGLYDKDGCPAAPFKSASLPPSLAKHGSIPGTEWSMSIRETHGHKERQFIVPLADAPFPTICKEWTKRAHDVRLELGLPYRCVDSLIICESQKLRDEPRSSTLIWRHTTRDLRVLANSLCSFCLESSSSKVTSIEWTVQAATEVTGSFSAKLGNPSKAAKNFYEDLIAASVLPNLRSITVQSEDLLVEADLQALPNTLPECLISWETKERPPLDAFTTLLMSTGIRGVEANETDCVRAALSFAFTNF